MCKQISNRLKKYKQNIISFLAGREEILYLCCTCLILFLYFCLTRGVHRGASAAQGAPEVLGGLGRVGAHRRPKSPGRASQPVSQPASEPASQPASQAASQAPSQPASLHPYYVVTTILCCHRKYCYVTTPCRLSRQYCVVTTQ